MKYDFSTRNRRFMNLYRNLELNGYYDPSAVLSLNDRRLAGLSPYSKRLKPLQEQAMIAECCKNPWYVLREVVRTQVGSSKRYVDFTNGEMLALLNFLDGGRTFVSAPVQTVKTTLLVYVILMTLPKVVLYSNDKKGAVFVSSIKKRYKQVIETMPPFLHGFFLRNFPEFIALSKHDMSSTVAVPGYTNSEVIIIQDNYEFDSWATPTNLRDLECKRTGSLNPIKHILVSSVNDNIDSDTKSYLDGIEPIQTHDIAIPSLGIKASSKMVSIRLETINRLRTDRAKTKYYKNIILNLPNTSSQSSLDSLFATR